jgi:uncharacterized membrane protein YqjE
MRSNVLDGSSQPSVTALVSGILADMQHLLAQQTRLIRLEVREDLHRARTGALFLGAGLGVMMIGGLLICVMLPLLLNWLTNDQIPLWACFAIFGVVFLLVGGGATLAAVKKFQDATSLPESSAALKENLTCLLRRN